MQKLFIVLLLLGKVSFADELNIVKKADPKPRERISAGQHIGGSVLSYLVGFGSGQAVEGTWDERGKKFTFGELGGFGVTLAGFAMCEKNSGNTLFPSISCPGASGILLTGGVIAWLTFRVWGVYDAIAYPFENNRRYDEGQNTSIYVDPLKSQIGLVFQF